MTGQPRPVQSIFTFFDPLFGRAALIVELDHIARFPPKVRDDIVDSWKKLARMPLDLRNNPAFPVLRLCLIPEINQLNRKTVHWGWPHGLGLWSNQWP